MSTQTGDEWLEQVARRMEKERENGAVPSPERVTVQEFIGKYGFFRRGGYINADIQNRLDELGLRATPDFTNAWFGATISIELEPELPGESPDGKRPDPTHRIDMLLAAHNKPMYVSPSDALDKAVTKMKFYDFSQLPVMTGSRDLKGIISWQSIGERLALGPEPKLVQDCMEVAQEISKDTPLFEAIKIIADRGYVLVRDQQQANVISGIVTASDLTAQFVQLSEPFLLAGEIEGHLRNLVRYKFSVEELQAVSKDKKVEGVADLDLGDYCHLLGNPSNWERLKLRIDRGEFMKHLDPVRETRNDVVHFSPDGILPERVQQLRDMTRFFGSLVKVGAM